jgi:hypothetical protein
MRKPALLIQIPTYRYQPTLHINYQETVLRMKDGLPKMKDLPEMGGSRETLPEQSGHSARR